MQFPPSPLIPLLLLFLLPPTSFVLSPSPASSWLLTKFMRFIGVNYEIIKYYLIFYVWCDIFYMNYPILFDIFGMNYQILFDIWFISLYFKCGLHPCESHLLLLKMKFFFQVKITKRYYIKRTTGKRNGCPQRHRR